MFRPAINKKTGLVELLNLNNTTDTTDYEIVRTSKEANEDSLSITWEWVKSESKTRKVAQKMSEQEEEMKIEEALWKSK